MQGGSSQGVALTAYVLIALLENKNNTQVTNTGSFQQAIANALTYLESQLSAISTDPYALNIIGYALTLGRSQHATTAVRKAAALAITAGGTKHWEQDTSTDTAADGVWRPPYTQSRSVDIEMTAYALLTFSHNKDVSNAVPIAKWIVAQRNPNGGFSSTQDTVVALQALAAFASLTLTSNGDSSGGVQINAVYGDNTHRFDRITRENALLLQLLELPATINSVRIDASGRGSALVQLNVKYNLLAVNDNPGIVLRTSTTEQNRMLNLRSCAKWTKPDQPSGMVVMEVNQLTGYSAVDPSAVQRQVGTALKRVEDDGDKLVLYFDELTGENTCVTLTSEKTQMVGNVQLSTVKVYSYYDPVASNVQFYGLPSASERNMCTVCPGCCRDGGNGGNTGAHSTATQLIITFTVAALLSYILLV